MDFGHLINTVTSYVEENLALSITLGFIFLLLLFKKPKYFLIFVLVVAVGLAVFELFQKLAVHTGLGGF